MKNMDLNTAKTLLEQVLRDVSYPDGTARTENFGGLRQVDAKIRDGRMVIAELPGFGERLAAEMAKDPDFEANSRRVRLEAMATYLRSAIQFLDAGVMKKGKKQLLRAPDVSPLVYTVPELGPVIERRWYEAQKCQHGQAYLAAVVMMGGILEALLLARANLSPAKAHQAKAAPRRKGGGNLPMHEWSAASLIDVAAELSWLKGDRKSFSHGLRDSRNVVHPGTRSRFELSSTKRLARCAGMC
jgi:hypothetical protein